MSNLWTISEDSFDPSGLRHQETIFTLGNGYLSTRGAFEEGYPDDHRATFIHGVFDAAPIVMTELANVPDWLPLVVLLNGERFSLHSGAIELFQREFDLRTGVLTRTVRWRSPSGHVATLIFERFASLADVIVAAAVRVGEARVVLTGGCFQNRALTERAIASLGAAGFRPYWHQRVPPNDGGLSLGQAVAAAALRLGQRAGLAQGKQALTKQ